jgi:ATP-dependent helicase/nuclease subunit A
MTVHGAKGLEAPVVLLVDAAAAIRGNPEQASLQPGDSASPVLYGVKRRHWEGPLLPDDTEPLQIGTLSRAGEHARQEARREEADILYVAMTRAKDALFVVGGEPFRTGDGESYWSWLQQAATADRDRESGYAEESTGTARPYSLEPPDWLSASFSSPQSRGDDFAAPPQRSTAAGDRTDSPLDRRDQRGGESLGLDIRIWSPPPQRPAVSVLIPSAQDEKAGRIVASSDEAEPSGEVRAKALKRGEAMHLWLQRATEIGTMPDGSGDVYEEAKAVFCNPEFAWIFFPETEGGRGLAEVPFVHRLPPDLAGKESTADRTAPPTEARVLGTMDRLVLRPGRADVIDYKSDTTVKNRAEAMSVRTRYRSQMARYRDAVRALFPERTIGAYLLFTHPRTESGRGILVPLETDPAEDGLMGNDPMGQRPVGNDTSEMDPWGRGSATT